MHSITLVAQDYFINFFISLFASTGFLVLLIMLYRPQIRISDRICIDKKDGKNIYVFKIVNMSRYNAYNCSFTLVRKTPYIIENNKVNYNLENLKLTVHSFHSIAGRKRKKDFGEHALLVGSYEDLSIDIDNENLSYELSVTSKHGFSNLSRVFKVSFESSKVFHHGSFKFGSNLDVIA